jgi:hypothetical protein
VIIIVRGTARKQGEGKLVEETARSKRYGSSEVMDEDGMNF